jgi:hypothetical protein
VSAPLSEPDDERRFPVLISTTNYYVVWAEGTSLKDAATRLADDPNWYEALNGEHPRDADYEITAPDELDWWDIYQGRREGPRDYCSHCDRYSHDARPLWHADGCPKAETAVSA